MVEEQHPPMWRVIGTSVLGASHARTGVPNQDAIHWFPESGAGPPLVLSVSDGHGSAKSFRSHWGALLAVHLTTSVLQEFWDRQTSGVTNLSLIKRTAEERLPQDIVRRWEQVVTRHITNEPLTLAELEALEKTDGSVARQVVEANPLVAYGATVLAALVGESFILYLQLGDGDILTVTEMGEVIRPLPRDERLFANETTSLCARGAWRDVVVGFQALVGVPPALILLATDGYANSFRDEGAFLKVGTDLVEMIRSDGVDTVDESLEAWLTEASQAGSGDDITLGVMCRMDAVEVSGAPRSQGERDRGITGAL